MVAGLNRLAAQFTESSEVLEAIALLSSGGDERIELSGETRLNRYMAAPYPRDVMAFASSTANDISADAFTHVLGIMQSQPLAVADRFEEFRARLRAAYSLGDDIDVVFAPSGTDLEYVPLVCSMKRREGGLHNILLGADEVGRGCIHSAKGRFFAECTALGVTTEPGQEIEGFPSISLADIPVRAADGDALASDRIAELAATEFAVAQASDRHPVLHIVHGSKTGLILPEIEDLDRLLEQHAGQVTLVVDACQARITTEALHAYLDREAIVLVTGSKFMGGPTFSGFALVPASHRQRAPRLPQGLAAVSRRPEWPKGWPGAECLPDGTNEGLLLRLEASIFELERFQELPVAQIAEVVDTFQRTLRRVLVEPRGFSLVQPYPKASCHTGQEHPVEMQTLATIDIGELSDATTFDGSIDLHGRLAMGGIRLGQPVKCVRHPEGGWGGTLRVGISMPQVVRWSAMEPSDRIAQMSADFRQIAKAMAKESVAA
ncbi:hypothetical protein [Qipengyuania qiaonensis]|uniref:Aminotransferase class V-fold PLP-dependent enzyme n=1 Tax=Qipengyuania qiaonensis TaxID=2867240 RepID=A0ABS7J1E3_9SPHN|nr:hypothetical protein [Qipengyuania qiaonensis]MBX7481162.1 hypothetical protein [Qipengyuania qiaonensis]